MLPMLSSRLNSSMMVAALPVGLVRVAWMAALIAVSPTVAVAQTDAGCRARVSAEGGYSISRTYADTVKSLFAWRKAVSERDGEDYQTWGRAADRRIDCQQRDITGVGRRWVCTRTAQPCSIRGSNVSTVVPTVRPDVVFGPRTLENGARGEFVRNLQRTLQDRGYDVVIDGRFGPATERMVRRFQTDQKIVVDGKVGPATKLKLLS